VKLRHDPWDPPFPVRLELRADGPVLVGQQGKRRVEVRPRHIRRFCLAEATDAERAALEEYGFRWLVME